MSESKSIAEVLEDRKRETSVTPAEDKHRCPDCRSCKIHLRTRDATRPKYYCEHCGLDFERPRLFDRDEIPEAMRR